MSSNWKGPQVYYVDVVVFPDKGPAYKENVAMVAKEDYDALRKATKVKPLHWVVPEGTTVPMAHTPFGVYRILEEDGSYYGTHSVFGVITGMGSTEEHAKTAVAKFHKDKVKALLAGA